jgi:hypothetical protein
MQHEIKGGCIMSCFGFLFSVRFWVVTWIAILFIGLTPQPPAVELVIVVGFVAHGVWFLQNRLRAFATTRALARAERAEEAEFRRRRWRSSGHKSELALVHPEPVDANYQRVTLAWSADGAGNRT